MMKSMVMKLFFAVLQFICVIILLVFGILVLFKQIENDKLNQHKKYKFHSEWTQ